MPKLPNTLTPVKHIRQGYRRIGGKLCLPRDNKQIHHMGEYDRRMRSNQLASESESEVDAEVKLRLKQLNSQQTSPTRAIEPQNDSSSIAVDETANGARQGQNVALD